MSFVVGLTGGIGSGKTTVANLFAQRGAAVVDTDLIAHELTSAGGKAMPPIAATFGPDVVCADGSLDRVAMRQLSFSNPHQRQRLEGILHPMIREESLARCHHANASSPYVLLVVPLLIESGAYREYLNRILVVDCDEARQVERVMARSGLSENEVRAIMAVQTSRSTRLAAADDVVDNDGPSGKLCARVDELHQYYLELSRKS